MENNSKIGNVGIAVFLVIFIGILAFLESPQMLEKEDISASFPVVASETDTPVSDETEEEKVISSHIPILESRLVDRTEVDGYIVETFQEYEVYKNENGEVLESVATENFDYIRYKK
ncbi:hypothetical protein ACFFIX_11405 [Metabacillus herbersteinensis]|uniref:Membrane protein insertase YidC n=2 Tax=Metabacillus herbersteinensis TaxID=283816 RepID=A0ABV6GEE8_9BACI